MAQSNAYYGVAPNDVVDAGYRYAYIATAGQTTFAATYTPGSVDVYLNGSKILPSEFTATNGTSVVLGTAAVLGDEVQIVATKVTPVVGAVGPTDLSNGLATKVSNTGNENIGGIKNFLSPVSVPAAVAPGDAVRKDQTHITSETPAVLVNTTTPFSVTLSVWTKVTLDNEVYDTAGCFASSRFTPNIPGFYQANGIVMLISVASTQMVEIRKNGTSSGYPAQFANSSGAPVSELFYMNGTTDYLELWTYIGATQNVIGKFNACLVRAA